MTDVEVDAWATLFALEIDTHAAAEPARRGGLFARLRENLSKPRQAISPQLAGIYAPKFVSAETWDALEEALIGADCGMDTTLALVDRLRGEAAAGRIVSGPDVARALRKELVALMADEPPRIPLGRSPTVILVVGVNGNGKTTTVGKLAHRLSELGQRVVIGAADTFRAGAIEQLAIWADRAGAQLVRQGPGADPGAVAFDAVAAGRARGADVVLIDTAGRLQTQRNLMEELKKVAGVVAKAVPDAPHEVLLVLDATTGQNGLSQAASFQEAVGVTGVVLTKLDGSAKGGIVVAIRQQLGLRVKIVGTGEGIEDLQPFDAAAFADAIFAADTP